MSIKKAASNLLLWSELARRVESFRNGKKTVYPLHDGVKCGRNGKKTVSLTPCASVGVKTGVRTEKCKLVDFPRLYGTSNIMNEIHPSCY
jgi:hypothetical protein